MEDLAILTENLSKKFISVEAVVNVNLNIAPGEIYALIGPNGAGKTTLIKTLVGLLKPTSGKALIFGNDITTRPLSAKRCFGYISDNPTAYEFLTGREFLELTGSLRKIPKEKLQPRLEELISLFPIREILLQQMGNYSRGNRQKVAFLAALLASPQLLIIDEPIVGLDPDSITIFGEQLKQYAENGGTVFFATHILSFAKTYASRVGVMHKGKLLREEHVGPEINLEEIYKSTTS